MKAELGRNTPQIPLRNPSFFSASQSSILSGALKGCLGSLDGACIEKLLLHCASALENHDVTLAQQVMWVLNNVASPVGDPNQRLAWWFLRALISRVGSLCPTSMNLNRSVNSPAQSRLMTVTEIAGYVDLIPWHRFGFCASNSAIFKAIKGYNKVHIIDLSITHCMQWPTLIDALAKRPEGPPSVRVSVPSWRPQVPPLLNVTSDEVGQRLGNFAKFKDVPFEFHVFGDDQTLMFSPSSPCISATQDQYNLLLNQLNPSVLNLKDDEALVINCQNWIRYLPNEGIGRPDSHEISCRDYFLDTVKGLNPCIITVVDEDSDLGALSLTSRITACFNYLWIPFDALETFLSKDNTQRIEYEADIGHKIENIIAFEGTQRIERLESGVKFSQRMRNTGFSSVPFGEDTISEVKFLLDEHASGWGMKKEDDMLVLTWKGHNSVYATAWVPYEYEEIIE